MIVLYEDTDYCGREGGMRKVIHAASVDDAVSRAKIYMWYSGSTFANISVFEDGTDMQKAKDSEAIEAFVVYCG